MKLRITSPIKSILLATISIFLICQNHILAQDKPVKIDDLLQRYHDYGQFDGAALVAENGKVIFKKGYGFANREWEIPNEPDTKFPIGSITKQFTAMLIMQLVEEGKIKLEGKVIDYLDNYRKDTGEKISIHHLLSHTSGLANWNGLPNFAEDQKNGPFSVEQHIKLFCSGDLTFEPGTRFNYSNPGYCILGAIIEKVTGKTFEQCLKDRIFDPLNMKNSGYAHHKSIIMNRAIGYVKHGSLYQNARSYDTSIGFASQMLYSTVEDLYLWDQALFTEKLLPKEHLNLMYKQYSPVPYGYGWCINKIAQETSTDSILSVFHPGNTFGFHSFIIRIIDHRYLVVLLSNAESRISLDEPAHSIFNILYNKFVIPPKKHIADTLDKIILKKDITSAIKCYYELKSMYPDDYDFSKEELEWLGEGLRERGMLNEAIDIYKLIIELFPSWWNAYRDAADIYVQKGDKELGMKFYTKSLEMNPEPWYAKEISEILKTLTKQDN